MSKIQITIYKCIVPIFKCNFFDSTNKLNFKGKRRCIEINYNTLNKTFQYIQLESHKLFILLEI